VYDTGSETFSSTTKISGNMTENKLLENQKFLLSEMMKLYNITQEDLKTKDTNWIKSKIRDFKLNQILK